MTLIDEQIINLSLALCKEKNLISNVFIAKGKKKLVVSYRSFPGQWQVHWWGHTGQPGLWLHTQCWEGGQTSAHHSLLAPHASANEDAKQKYDTQVKRLHCVGTSGWITWYNTALFFFYKDWNSFIIPPFCQNILQATQLHFCVSLFVCEVINKNINNLSNTKTSEIQSIRNIQWLYKYIGWHISPPWILLVLWSSQVHMIQCTLWLLPQAATAHAWW